MSKPDKIKKYQKGKTNNPAGRPVGIVSKKTREVEAIFDEFAFDPIRNALQKLKDVNDPEVYITVCLKLAKFKYPEKKAVEHMINPKELSDKELVEETKALLDEVGGEK